MAPQALCPSRLSGGRRQPVGKLTMPRLRVACSASQESATATVSDKEVEPEKKEAVAEKAAEKPKPAVTAKAPVKPLPEMMEEEVIPALRSTIEAQENISEVELSFHDNRLEGSLIKDGVPYNFWAFFPNGDLKGPKGFSLSSYGSEASTVEPFLIDEKRATHKHVVFWVVKRLAAQGIIPVWRMTLE